MNQTPDHASKLASKLSKHEDQLSTFMQSEHNGHECIDHTSSNSSLISTPGNDTVISQTQGPTESFWTAQRALLCMSASPQYSKPQDDDSQIAECHTPISLTTPFVQHESFDFDMKYEFGTSLIGPRALVGILDRDIIRESPEWALAILKKRISNGARQQTTKKLPSPNVSQIKEAKKLACQLPDTQNGDSNFFYSQASETQNCIVHSLDDKLPGTQGSATKKSVYRHPDNQKTLDNSHNTQLPDTQIGNSLRSGKPPFLIQVLDRERSDAQIIHLLSKSTLEETNLSLTQRDSLLPNTQGSPTNIKNFFTTTTYTKTQHNTISIRERKRLILPSTRPAKLTTAFKNWRDKTHALLDPFREDDDCWFHPSPPPARTINGVARPVGKLQKSFQWQDRSGTHSVVLNYGIVSKLLRGQMTKLMKDGFVNKRWHLSHLCGNWTCLNPAHTTVEPGSVNISRNNCFSHRSGCLHQPPCMKELKVSLGTDGKPVDHELLANTVISPKESSNNWDDWTQTFDDDDNDDYMALVAEQVEDGELDGMEGLVS